MIEADLINLVSTVGLPLALSTFYILKANKTIENNTIVMTEIKEVIRKCNK